MNTTRCKLLGDLDVSYKPVAECRGDLLDDQGQPTSLTIAVRRKMDDRIVNAEPGQKLLAGQIVKVRTDPQSYGAVSWIPYELVKDDDGAKQPGHAG